MKINKSTLDYINNQPEKDREELLKIYNDMLKKVPQTPDELHIQDMEEYINKLQQEHWDKLHNQ